MTKKPMSVTALVVMIYLTGLASGLLAGSVTSFVQALFAGAMAGIAVYFLAEEVQRLIKAGPR